MNPAERVRIITETARAVLDGRLDAVTGATTLTLQEQQIAPHLRSDRIDVTQACTMCDPSRFYSFRRDGKRSGRMLSAIAAR